ncbi:MAG: CAP domain-containing protein [Acidimicrobiia bacterium]|nr:CAP domain-containing protein [Acidimicrobiia bacterium]
MKAGRWVCVVLVLASLVASACGDNGQDVIFEGPGESSRDQAAVSTDESVSRLLEADNAFGEFAAGSVEVSLLRLLAVDLVNERRRELGRSPLRTGDSVAAQLVAEESLASFALLDYTQDGLPMGALYTATGGRGAVLTSGRISGYLDAASVERCRSGVVVCQRTDAAGDLAAYVGSRLDGASAHGRDSLLFPGWETLHVGVAYSDFTLVVILQLEHQEVTYLSEPSVSGGFLSVELAPSDGAVIKGIDIYHYPAPPSSEAALARDKVLSIYQPPSSGEVVTLPDDRAIAADYWSADGGATSIGASIAGRLPGPGLYEIVVWAGSEVPASQYFLNLDDPTVLQLDPSLRHDARDEAPTPEELRAFALDLINADRRSYGVPPVRLGTNAAAQVHAEDAVRSGYLAGHWTSGGMKPYMLYTQAGGVGVMAENAAGQTTGAEDCDRPTVVCGEIDVLGAIESMQWSMMYDDAHADWGHRDTIINPIYDTVNIGIAFTDTHVAFYQHFEYTTLAHEVAPSLEDGILELLLQPLASLEIGPIFIFYDPPPTPKESEEISRLTAYCLGGGFTDNCADMEPIARVLKPPSAGSYYADLEQDDVVARSWNVSEGGRTRVEADLRQLIARPGVYTIVIYSDTEQLEPLSIYSIFR